MIVTNQTIYVIGTDHRYQNLCSDFTKAQHDEFSQMASDSAVIKKIQLISEENNMEALKQSNICKSSLQLVAAKLGVTHLFTEASMKFRNENGMEQENRIRHFGWLNNLDEQEIINNIQKSHRKRELYWFRKITEANIWPVLHICGANHANEFTKLVHNSGLSAELLSVDWSN